MRHRPPESLKTLPESGKPDSGVRLGYDDAFAGGDLMSERNCLAIVLAAGEGTRMRSTLPKVLHAIAGQPMVAHVLTAIRNLKDARVAVVVGPDRADVADQVRRIMPRAEIFEQRERKGTAHAVLMAKPAIAKGADDILVLFADTPLVGTPLLEKLRAPLAKGAAIVVLGFRPADPAGYGRLLMSGDELTAIREEKDASVDEKKIGLCNGGLMAIDGERALAILDKIGNDNAKGEYYLTDAVAIARDIGLRTAVIEAEENDVRGINTKGQLAEAEAALQDRLRAAAMEAGATLVAPETVFLAADTKIGRDVTIEPYVVIGPGVKIEDGAIIRSFSHLEGAQIGKGARVGPYARLRPGADLGQDVHIGNFVEVKASTIEAGAKANHLSYIGDARVGEGANVGAGTITCNYDGAFKHRTDIGKGAFIGSNTALVAPVKIGDGAYVGSGSVISADIPADALALERAQTTVKEGWAKRLRDKQAQAKKAR
jgi:bifunctional UDP-N-acetylglucosamine pyrophosphorylase / glucosamine-1-phosphate N-acetyltransferase